MIKLIKSGRYKLAENERNVKHLTLDKNKYILLKTKTSNKIRGTVSKPRQTDIMLSLGNYRMYQIKTESKMKDQIRLELHVGQGLWQGYRLSSEFPAVNKLHVISPVHETISKSQSAAAANILK